MHSDVSIICFRGMQLGHLSSQATRVISMNLENQSKRQGKDKCNPYLSKGICWSPKTQDTFSLSSQKTIWINF